MTEYIRTITSKDSGTYILVGNRNTLEKEIQQELKKNYQVLTYSEKSFDIDSVRLISKEHSKKAVDKRLFIVSFYTISIPAQNALLKILEEPAQNTVFCLITSDQQKLLPTVISRALTLRVRSIDADFSKKLQDLLATDPAYRLENSFLKKTLALKDEEDKVDREAISELVESAILYCQKKQQEKTIKNQKEESQIFSRILELYKYAHQSGSSLKIIAEYTFLTLPQYK